MYIILYLLLLLSHHSIHSTEEQSALYKKIKPTKNTSINSPSRPILLKCPCCWGIITLEKYTIHRLKECPQFFGNWEIEK